MTSICLRSTVNMFGTTSKSCLLAKSNFENCIGKLIFEALHCAAFLTYAFKLIVVTKNSVATNINNFYQKFSSKLAMNTHITIIHEDEKEK